MRKTWLLVFLFTLSATMILGGGPANKATGSVIRVRAGADPQTAASWTFDFVAHEKVEMRNGKTRPAKGMATAVMVDDSSRYWAIDVKCVNVLSDTEAVFAGEVVMTSGIGRISRGDYFKIWVKDFGEPGPGADVLFSQRTDPDDIDVLEDAISFCVAPEDHMAEMSEWVVLDGNLQVHYRATEP